MLGWDTRLSSSSHVIIALSSSLAPYSEVLGYPQGIEVRCKYAHLYCGTSYIWGCNCI